ncbi:MAG: aryl-sulfate sulfotransferase N-terminal domain-containing protein [Flavonifractor plautii]
MHRLGRELMELAQQRRGTPPSARRWPLLNPFGTGSNGLLLAFQTDRKSEIRYTIHTTSAELPDYTATAQGLGDKQFSRKHCFLLVGSLVPGETRRVTLEAIGEWGKVQERATFTIEMPPSSSGYDSRLTHTDGDSAAALSDGLFYRHRTGRLLRLHLLL